MPFPAVQCGGTAHAWAKTAPTAPALPALPSSPQQAPAFCQPHRRGSAANYIRLITSQCYRDFLPPLTKKICFHASYYFSIQSSSLRCLILTCRLFYIKFLVASFKMPAYDLLYIKGHCCIQRYAIQWAIKRAF